MKHYFVSINIQKQDFSSWQVQLYCTVQPSPQPRTSDLGGWHPPPATATVTWWPTLETYSNVFPLNPLEATSGGGNWSTHGLQAVGTNSRGVLSCLFTRSAPNEKKNSKGISHCNLVLTVTAVTELLVTAVNGFGARICSFWLDVRSNQQKPVKNPSWLPAYSKHVTNFTD